MEGDEEGFIFRADVGITSKIKRNKMESRAAAKMKGEKDRAHSTGYCAGDSVIRVQ